MAIYDRNAAINTRRRQTTSTRSGCHDRPTWSGKRKWVDYEVNPAMQSSGPIGRQYSEGDLEVGRCQTRGRAGRVCNYASPTMRSAGAELWRRRTIPAPGEPGDETWGGVPFEERKHVGTWMGAPGYDPELKPDLSSARQSRLAPAPKLPCSAASTTHHLYHNSTLALTRGHRRDHVVLPAPE